jgi:hypothetical protein
VRVVFSLNPTTNGSRPDRHVWRVADARRPRERTRSRFRSEALRLPRPSRRISPDMSQVVLALPWDHSWDQTHRSAPSCSGFRRHRRSVASRLPRDQMGHPGASGAPLHTREVAGSNPAAPIDPDVAPSTELSWSRSGRRIAFVIAPSAERIALGSARTYRRGAIDSEKVPDVPIRHRRARHTGGRPRPGLGEVPVRVDARAMTRGERNIGGKTTP